MYDDAEFISDVVGAVTSDGFWAATDLVVCTGPFALCGALVRILGEDAGRSLLVYQGLAFHSMAPVSASGRARYYEPLRYACQLTRSVVVAPSIASVTITGESLSCPAGAGPRLVVATNSPINAAQLAWQAGARVPVVRFHGLYTQVRHLVGTETSSILVFRFVLWERPVGIAFRGLLRQFSDELPGGLAFHFLDAGEYIDYEDMARHRAVFLFPWDSELVVFHELYSAGIPLLLPDLAWLGKWQPFIPWGSTDVGNGAERNDWSLPHVAHPDFWPCPPWIENHGMLKGNWSEIRADVFVNECPHFWMRQTHFMRYPHVVRVASIPELLLAPLVHDLGGISSAMAEFNADSLQATLRFYRWALAWLLGER